MDASSWPYFGWVVTVAAATEATAREYGKTLTEFDTESCHLPWPARVLRDVDEPRRLHLAGPRRLHRHCEDRRLPDGRYGLSGNTQLYGVQFHPEVQPYRPRAAKFCATSSIPSAAPPATGPWRDYTRRPPSAPSAKRSAPASALLALSGGVDSSVAAALMAEAIGSQLTCVFVDHGLMRKNEGDEVEAAFGKWDIHFIRVNAEDRFLSKLAGVTDPETKRKIIGGEFIRVFEAEAKKIGAVDYLVQGTIYPDVIESGLGKSAVIKSHHNVGGLPDYVDFKEIIEPLRMLFKDEVRAARPRAGSAGVSGHAPALPRPGSCHPRHRRYHEGKARHAARRRLHLPRRDRQGRARPQSQPVFRGPHLHALRRRHG